MNFEVVYLRTLITSKCEAVKEIDTTKLSKDNRIADIMNYLLKVKQMSTITKITLYETVIRPTALYGCKTEVLKQATRKMLRRWERKLLRSILGWKKD